MTDRNPIDLNGDGVVSDRELELHLEAKRKELEDADAMRDAQFLTSLFGLHEAATLIANVAPTYFVAVAGLVAAFFGADAIKKK